MQEYCARGVKAVLLHSATVRSTSVDGRVWLLDMKGCIQGESRRKHGATQGPLELRSNQDVMFDVLILAFDTEAGVARSGVDFTPEEPMKKPRGLGVCRRFALLEFYV